MSVHATPVMAGLTTSWSAPITAGFVGSGPMVLLLEAVLHIGAQPKFWQRAVGLKYDYTILYFIMVKVAIAKLDS